MLGLQEDHFVWSYLILGLQEDYGDVVGEVARQFGGRRAAEGHDLEGHTARVERAHHHEQELLDLLSHKSVTCRAHTPP